MAWHNAPELFYGSHCSMMGYTSHAIPAVLWTTLWLSSLQSGFVKLKEHEDPIELVPISIVTRSVTSVYYVMELSLCVAIFENLKSYSED